LIPAAVLERALRVIAAVLLFSMMALTITDVAGRYLFSHPIPGAFELTQLLLAWLIFAGLPTVSARGGHISIGLLDRFFVGRLGRAANILIDLVGAGVTGLIAWRLWALATRMGEYGDRFAFLPLSKAVVAYPMSLLAAVTVLALLVKAASPEASSK
jgi:TRAP-type C4-dicarboxylate transport system permease small subunit